MKCQRKDMNVSINNVKIRTIKKKELNKKNVVN
jgi:hypothetical protein